MPPRPPLPLPLPLRSLSTPLRPSSLRPLPLHHSPSRPYSAPLSNTIPASKTKYVPTTGQYPSGFLAASTHVGIKPSTPPSVPDLTLITSTVPCSAAAVFTQNKFQAAPVVVSREVLQKRRGEGVRGIVVNSGCANAVTGAGGREDAEAMVKEVDRCLDLQQGKSEEQTDNAGSALVMSTGVIGQRLPITKILSAIPTAAASLSSTHDAWLASARAICTTDTFPKLRSQTFTLPSHPSTTYRLAGMTKGAGMIHPNMATLLGLLFTDCSISPECTQSLLSHAVTRSFNSISVDGDTSTNDTVSLLANGAASPPSPSPSSSSPYTITSPTSPDYTAFLATLTTFTQSLAHLIIRDGEGATKFVTVRVAHAPTYDLAHRVASSIARSPLVKTALYGGDANWGRVLCAVGYTAGVKDGDIVPEETSVSFVRRKSSSSSSSSPSSAQDNTSPSITSELRLLINGEPEAVDEDRAATFLKDEDLEILVRLRREEADESKEEAVYWTCDFSHEYVTINGDYRT
ncbi:MAG: hypothetical protein M1817_006422 [Caeruleum heppii]|nr:MAG: hypothetical protein M1817_006422 [Caeruleum heppii]